METIVHNHVTLHREYPEQVGLGKVRNNPRRLDVEEAARIAGLDITVNAVVNHKKQILGLFVGDFVEAHRKGVSFANRVYATENPGRFDLMVVNAFPLEESPEKALWPARESLNDGGDVILLRDVDGTDVDVLVYGAASYPGVAPFAGELDYGWSLERRPPIYDTDDCSVDFVPRYPATPGSVPSP